MDDITFVDMVTPHDYNMLHRKVGWEELTPGQAERGLRHTTFVVGAVAGSKTIGMGRILFDFGYTAYLGDILVDPAFQGRGIGRQMVQRLMDKVFASAQKGDRLMFILGAAPGKEGFYQKLGFEARPSESYGAGMTKWVLVD